MTRNVEFKDIRVGKRYTLVDPVFKGTSKLSERIVDQLAAGPHKLLSTDHGNLVFLNPYDEERPLELYIDDLVAGEDQRFSQVKNSSRSSSRSRSRTRSAKKGGRRSMKRR